MLPVFTQLDAIKLSDNHVYIKCYIYNSLRYAFIVASVVVTKFDKKSWKMLSKYSIKKI